MKPILNDPEMKALSEALSAPGVPTIAQNSPEQMRKIFASMLQPSNVELPTVGDSTVAGPNQTLIPVRTYVPEGTPRAEIIYFHGGGWVIGSIEDYDHFLRLLAVQTGCIVHSVEYRLAPEHVFPAAVDDAWAAVQALTVMDRPVIVAGDSAGGNLAAVVAQIARCEGGPHLAGQVLIYPFTNGDLGATGLRAFEAPVLPREDIASFVQLYVPDPEVRMDPRFSPLNGDVDGVAPALIVTAEADLLTFHGTDYARKLAQAGVKVEVYQRESTVHGYLSLMPESVAGQATMTKIADFILSVVSKIKSANLS